jgi:NAD(P)-dependent dehydrogenase (short-subunit alcohol dehydrogenase family)
MDLHLTDKVALITGGSMGIGLAVAESLAREKAHVILCARDEAKLVAEAERLTATYGVRALPVKTDVTNTAALAHLVSEVERAFGGIDILFNNAGTGTNETILDAPDDRWQYYWELHVMAAVRLSRALAPGMKRRGGGAIVNNASICATQPLYNEPIYNVTKAALVMFTKCLAHELIPDNIRVNAVNPGLIETAGWTDWAKTVTADTPETWQERLGKVADEHAPIGRFASPQELADFIVFLCSPRASYCVGSSYYVDGGWLRTVT